MQDRPSAEEHLRVIRSLMERATIYRAISAQAALAGGVLACLAAALDLHGGSQPAFLCTWGGVLLVATAANFYFLWRDAARRGAPFISAGMRMALLAMLPPLAVGFVGTFVLYLDPLFQALFWLVVYGLALLSTSHFAPRSLVLLGVLFLTTGLVLSCLILGGAMRFPESNVLMAVTFGGYHLAYAACTWPRKAPAPEAAVSA